MRSDETSPSEDMAAGQTEDETDAPDISIDEDVEEELNAVLPERPHETNERS